MIKEYMTYNVIKCNIKDNVNEVAEIMSNNDIGLVAVEDNNNIIGVITDRDLVIGPVVDDSKKIEDFITKDIVSLKEDDDIDDALITMKENKVKRLLITDDNGNYTGVLSIFDLLDSKKDKEIIATLKKIKE